MKRDPRLRDLSVEHHHALVLARRATVAARGEGDGASVEDVWRDVVRRFHQELEPHFRLEEAWLLPLVARGDGDGAALAARTHREHTELRELVAGEPSDLTPRLARFGALLHAHVRFEEQSLFEFIQTHALLDAPPEG